MATTEPQPAPHQTPPSRPEFQVERKFPEPTKTPVMPAVEPPKK